MTRDLRGRLASSARRERQGPDGAALPAALPARGRPGASSRSWSTTPREQPLTGERRRSTILDPETEQEPRCRSSASTGGAAGPSRPRRATAPTLTFPLDARRARVGTVAFQVVAARPATSPTASCGRCPCCPSRMHLAQSRFVTLRGARPRATLTFDDLAQDDDPTRHRRAAGGHRRRASSSTACSRRCPTSSTTRTSAPSRRSTGSSPPASSRSLFEQLPGGGADGEGAARKRETPLEAWDAARPEPADGARGDALAAARRGAAPDGGAATCVKVLDPQVARAKRDGGARPSSRRRRPRRGGFPWFPGGPPSPYMTLYILYGFATAPRSSSVEVPQEMVAARLALPRAGTIRDEWVARER